MSWEELYRLSSVGHHDQAASGWVLLATALVAATQRPTVMKYAYRTATELYPQEFQSHQIGLVRPFSPRELTAGSLETGPCI